MAIRVIDSHPALRVVDIIIDTDWLAMSLILYESHPLSMLHRKIKDGFLEYDYYWLIGR